MNKKNKERLKGIVYNAKEKLESIDLYERLVESVIKVDGKLKDFQNDTTEKFNTVFKGMQELFDSVVGLDNRLVKIEKKRIKDGKTPVKGVDYFDGKDGEDGYTPIKGKDYFDGKDGKDGRDGKDGKDGKNGITKTIKEVVEKELSSEDVRDRLEMLVGEARLSSKAVKDLPESIHTIETKIERIGSQGIRQFTKLKDTPSSFKGKRGRLFRVKEDESGLEYVDGRLVYVSSTPPTNPKLFDLWLDTSGFESV